MPSLGTELPDRTYWARSRLAALISTKLRGAESKGRRGLLQDRTYHGSISCESTDSALTKPYEDDQSVWLG